MRHDSNINNAFVNRKQLVKKLPLLARRHSLKSNNYVVQNLRMLCIACALLGLLPLVRCENFEVIRDHLGCLHAHNVVRARHGVENVTWDDDLGHGAGERALHLAKHGIFALSKLNGYGELLFRLDGASKPCLCDVAVNAWYEGAGKYDFDKHGYSESTAHFTELVWKAVQRIGVGIVFNPGKRTTYIVARYVPRGNSKYDAFEANVLPPKAGIPIPTREQLAYVPGRKIFQASLTVLEDPTKPCEDLGEECEDYMHLGYCNQSEYHEWMAEWCSRTCNFCKPGTPIDGRWSNWIKVEECKKTCTILQQRFCISPEPSDDGKTCGGPFSNLLPCEDGSCDRNCVDKSEECDRLQMMGHCDEGSAQYTWMLINCPSSCDQCPLPRKSTAFTRREL